MDALKADSGAVSKDVNAAHKSSRLHNLLGRLISQPVLDQKSGMLQFLHHLSDLPAPAEYHEPGEVLPETPTKHTRLNAPTLGSPAFNQAFSRQGLAQLPVNDGSPKAPPRSSLPSDKPERLEKRMEKRTQDLPKEQVVDGQAAGQNETTTGPTESSLLRDLPFTLQGLSSTNLTFPSSTALKLPPTLPVPLISLLHTLAEPSLLYRGLSEFVETTEGGLVGQSFRSALGRELRSYLGLVATLEGQIRRALAQLDFSQPHGGIGKAGVTLKRCVIWTREATWGLRLMSLMVEESKGTAHIRTLNAIIELTICRQKRRGAYIPYPLLLLHTW
jgi:gamma-tubulin complex component 3